jgi:hypothetical protein
VTTSSRCDRARLRKQVARTIKVATLFLLALLVAVEFGSSNGYAQSREPLVEHAGWIDWNGDNFFGPCRGDCAFSLYGGQEVTTALERILFIKYPAKPFWTWHWGNSSIIAGEFSRRLVTFGNVLSLEPQFGIGQRLGGMHATEFWGAIRISWTAFPWNNYIRTSVGLSEGLSVTTQIDADERLLDNYKIVGNRLVFPGSDLLNYFTPEITLALPEYPTYELALQMHHRSGIFGLINGVDAGAQFFTVGLRRHF